MSPNGHSVLIVDDEPPARDRLERLIGELPGWTVAASCGSAAEALRLARRLGPTVVLLDVRMPGMHGIDAARKLHRLEPTPAVIFTTAYDQYALQAFESRAVDYLLKPVRRERLERALERAARVTAPAAHEAVPARAALQPIAARVRGALQLIPLEEVLYLRAEHKVVLVRHVNGEAVIERSLKRLEHELGSVFLRAHRGLLVNAGRIESLERQEPTRRHSLRLRGCAERLPVSRRRLAELKERLVKGAIAV